MISAFPPCPMADHTVTLRPPVWAILLAVAIGGVFFLAGKHIESRDPMPSTITVSGEGKVNAAPDIAELSFGVRVERAKTSQEAMTKLTTGMTAVIDSVKAAGIDPKDIRTEQLSLNPAYDWTNGTQLLRGYDAFQTLRVKVRDMSKTSAVLGAATAAGANQANDVQFTIDEPDALRGQARREAIADAQQKAQALASQLGVRLGKLKGFHEDGGAWPQPPVYYGRGGAMEADAAQSAPPLPAGEQEVRVGVSLTYEVR
jgi:uncharacterized protein